MDCCSNSEALVSCKRLLSGCVSHFLQGDPTKALQQSLFFTLPYKKKVGTPHHHMLFQIALKKMERHDGCDM